MANGWILLNRNLQDHWLWKDEPYDKARAWIDLLFLANYEDKKTLYKGEIIDCKRGDVNLSIKYLSERWKWTRKKTTYFIKALEKDQMVTTNITKHRTTITIVNYGFYQDLGTTKGTTKGASRVTTKEQPRNITKEIKEVNKVKEIKNIYGEYGHVKLTTEEYERLAADYGIAMRDAAIKFLDEYMVEKPKYKSESHNLAIRRWVINAVNGAKGKEPKNSGKLVGNTEVYTDQVKPW